MTENNIHYSESKDQAAEYLRLSLSLMAQHNSAPTPPNYSVWYDYVSRNNSKLKEAVDSRIKSSKPLTPQLMEELFREHIALGDQTTTREALSALQHIVDKVTQHLKETGGSVSKHEVNLQSSAALLNDNLNVSTVRQITSTIIAETEGIRKI